MIYFTRHGQTDANLKRLLAGSEWDISLNDTGRRQAQDCAKANRHILEQIQAVYVSPMARPRETMEIMTQGYNLPVETVPDLKEWNLGDWSGKGYNDVPDIFEHKPHPPGGESWADFELRCLNAFKKIAEDKRKILIVAHGGVWHTYADRISHAQLDIDNCKFVEICRHELAAIDTTSMP